MLTPKRLKILRLYHGLTQSQLASISGLSESLIAAMELGTRTITHTSQQRISDLLITSQTISDLLLLIH